MPPRSNRRAAATARHGGGISGSDRSQLLLLPDTIEDYVSADNPVCFIDGGERSARLRHTIAGMPRGAAVDGAVAWLFWRALRARLSRLADQSAFCEAILKGSKNDAVFDTQQSRKNWRAMCNRQLY